MQSKLITMRQLGQFVSEHQPEKIIEESYVWWLIRQNHDIIVSWNYGNVLSCVAYFPVTSDDYDELLRMADRWNGMHGWSQVKTLARFRLDQIRQAIDGRLSLAVVG
jgi:hypothetical protein